MYITVLCKVVDNFGDIGVAWRLCRRLAKIQSKYKICLVVDDMEAFSVIAEGSYVFLCYIADDYSRWSKSACVT